MNSLQFKTGCYYYLYHLAVWLSGNVLVPHQAQLEPRWVTTLNDLGDRTSHPDLLSPAIPPRVGTVSTSESWGANRHIT